MTTKVTKAICEPKSAIDAYGEMNSQALPEKAFGLWQMEVRAFKNFPLGNMEIDSPDDERSRYTVLEEELSAGEKTGLLNRLTQQETYFCGKNPQCPSDFRNFSKQLQNAKTTPQGKLVEMMDQLEKVRNNENDTVRMAEQYFDGFVNIGSALSQIKMSYCDPEFVALAEARFGELTEDIRDIVRFTVSQEAPVSFEVGVDDQERFVHFRTFQRVSAYKDDKVTKNITIAQLQADYPALYQDEVVPFIRLARLLDMPTNFAK